MENNIWPELKEVGYFPETGGNVSRQCTGRPLVIYTTTDWQCPALLERLGRLGFRRIATRPNPSTSSIITLWLRTNPGMRPRRPPPLSSPLTSIFSFCCGGRFYVNTPPCSGYLSVYRKPKTTPFRRRGWFMFAKVKGVSFWTNGRRIP